MSTICLLNVALHKTSCVIQRWNLEDRVVMSSMLNSIQQTLLCILQQNMLHK